MEALNLAIGVIAALLAVGAIVVAIKANVLSTKANDTATRALSLEEERRAEEVAERQVAGARGITVNVWMMPAGEEENVQMTTRVTNTTTSPIRALVWCVVREGTTLVGKPQIYGDLQASADCSFGPVVPRARRPMMWVQFEDRDGRTWHRSSVSDPIEGPHPLFG